MSERGLESMGPEELLSSEWNATVFRPIKKYFKVADGIDFVVEKMQMRGLNLLEVWKDDSGHVLYSLRQHDARLDDAVPFWSVAGTNKGIWVQEKELE